MTRLAYVTYCDDVRLEVNGKHSLIGIYSEAMYLPSFPTNVMKLCAVINAITDEANPFKDFKISASYNGVLIAELEATAEQIQTQAAQTPNATLRSVQAQMIFAPFILDKPGELTITFLSEGAAFECNTLKVLIAPEGMTLIQ
jgi:hypothetical protein